ncbi:MAG: hypothetical protein HY287_08020 [Planctomycetes bacterium]|nr:hypothetical protein [Planctomycetota bacterium]
MRTLSLQMETLKAQVRQAQQLAVVGRTAATTAHEVNNLLTPMLAYAESAVNSDNVEFLRKALRITVKNARMLVGMSERVLEISAPRPLKLEIVDVRSIVDAAIESLCRDLSKDGISTHIEIASDLKAYCDPLQIQQVLFNLFLNARQAMEKSHGGLLKVTGQRTPIEASGTQFPSHPTASRQFQIELQIHNTGAPIPRDLLPQMFEPFQSSKSAANGEKSRCHGLGLSLCREFIEENGGRIRVTSSADAGTTFTLILPSE